LYGLEACPLVKSDLSSLDFVMNRFVMKLFKTDVVKTCQQCSISRCQALFGRKVLHLSKIKFRTQAGDATEQWREFQWRRRLECVVQQQGKHIEH